MECKIALTLLEPYLDNELDRADARELEAHVDGCAGCRAALTRCDDLRGALREQSLRYTAPQVLRERITASMDQANSSSGAAMRVTRQPAWLRYAAACLLAFGAGGVSVQLWNSAPNSSQAQITHDLFASHWRALAAASPVDVVSSDRHTVKPWFAGKTAQAPLVQDFAAQGFPLIGGRIDYVGGERVPVLVYRHGQHQIDVFVLSAERSGAVTASQLQGYELNAIRLGSQPAAIVSDLDAQELARFAQLLSAAK